MSEISSSSEHTSLSHVIIGNAGLVKGIPFVFNSWIVRHLTQEDYAPCSFIFLSPVSCFSAGKDSAERDEGIIFAMSQTTYGACLFLGYWGYFLLLRPFRSSALFPFRELSENHPDKKRKLGTCLTEALKLVLLIGLVFMAFCPSYSYSLIRLVYGHKWSDGEAVKALQYYCLYVIVLAMNGTSEAFLHVVANENQIKRSNEFITCVLAYLCSNECPADTVSWCSWLNSSQFVKILYSGIIIRGFFEDSCSFSFPECLPSGSTVLLFSGTITLISERLFLERENFWQTFAIHFSVGFACFCMSAFVIYRRERPFINKIICFRATLTKNYTFPPVNNKVAFP
ncbi:hypothetical protein TIFTF001_010238 [Ficus carica]|uniref:Protein RFT1 homolog n=1 Tax=Ficus carica TaxID=3494 RepID=A0AA87ZXT9_FICCA|nr:hypothetical protein TIFTF001_010238 [Ficus carica]